MSIRVINSNVPYKLVGLMSLHIHHMNLIKSLRSLHRLWIFTSFSWALPDVRVGASNSRFCRCGSNLWLASTLSIWVSKLQPKESPLLSLSGDIFCCVTLTVPRAVCAVPATASPTSLSLWVTSPKEASPARLCLLMRVRMPSPPPQHAWN